MSNVMILAVIACILAIVMAILLIVLIIKYNRLDDHFAMLAQENEKLNEDMKLMSSDYSDKILTFIRTFATQLSVIYYNEFVDNHEIDKVNKQQVEHLITDICNQIRISLQMSQIKFDRALFTRDFLDEYIIQTVIANVKALWTKTLEEGV